MNFQDLKRGFQAEVKNIEKQLAEFPWENKEVYANWCAQTYHYVCHSTRLLAVSAGIIPLDMDELYYRYIAHLKEESGHEKLALRDVEKLGYSLADFPELAVTSSFYQTQYYLIEHVSPFSFFGYILILEGLSANYGKKCHARALKAHGSDTANFWRVHAEDDPEHVGKAFEYIKKLNECEYEAIYRNLWQSRERYGELLDKTARTAVRKSREAA